MKVQRSTPVLLGVGAALLLQLVLADEWPRTVDFDSVTADVTVLGGVAGDNLGYALDSGDFNGDGAADVIIGAHTAGPDGRLNAGEAFAVLGGDGVQGPLDLSTTAAGLRVMGAEEGVLLGYDVAAGDFNGDGFDDMVLGAYGADPQGRPGAGATFVIFGRPTLQVTVDLAMTRPDVEILGAAAGDRSGYAVAAGDVNGDGFDDIVIGSYTADAPGGMNAGRADVVLGRAAPPATIDLSVSSDFSVLGQAGEDATGASVATGDVNGDGFDDVVIGAEGADPAGGFQAGRTYVIFGRSDPDGARDLAATPADLTIHGANTADRSGSTVATGDVNGDGYVDVIVGAQLANAAGRTDAGETYVIYGGAAPPAVVDLASEPAGLTVYGDNARDRSGAALAAGDITGDGIDDLVVGAFFADPLERTGAGETYVIRGGPVLPAVIDLDSSPADVTLLGDDDFDTLGRAVAVGDTNADGGGDLIIGAAAADPGGRSGAGEVYVLFGKGGPSGTPAPTPTTTPPAPIRGDANADRTVDRLDVTLILQFGAGLIGPLAGGDAADINGDAAIDSRDAMIVLQYLAGLIDGLG